VFSGLENEDLLIALQDAYTPEKVLDYGEARDTMFGTIYNQNDTIYGVYSNFPRYLDPTMDPTEALYLDGGGQSINTEHTYPQSKGAEFGNAKSDLHHLFPCKTSVNSARASDSFDEINDQNTDTWYYLNLVSNQIPNTNIEKYSEKGNGAFEPQESHKGNVARAMFYFYSIYRIEANAADPGFFENQRLTLCDWHSLDPVDQKEWERTYLIAKHQDNTPNPFVLDCSLASRLYCQDLASNCRLLSNKTPTVQDIEIKIYPNPSSNDLNLDIRVGERSNIKLLLFNFHGKQLYEEQIHIKGGLQTINCQTDLPQGIYFVSLLDASGIIYNKKIIIE
jgi:endonuclease I